MLPHNRLLLHGPTTNHLNRQWFRSHLRQLPATHGQDCPAQLDMMTACASHQARPLVVDDEVPSRSSDN